MSALIPETHQDLLQPEARAFAFLATVAGDGRPQVTPVWFDMEGDWIRINTARGRVKDRNMTEQPHVALAIMDPADSYRYIQIRGVVASIEEAGAREHIDLLSQKYTGNPSYAGYGGETRVIYRIQPQTVSTMG